MNSVPGDEELPLAEHLKELRSRVITAVIPIAAITLIAFMFSGRLLKLIWTQTVPVPMYIYSPTELITAKLLLSLLCALFLGVPLMVYEAFMFVAKGLYRNEKMFFIKIVPFSFILFFIGAALAYFIVAPIIFRSAVVLSGDVASPQNAVMRTIYTLLTLVAGFGIVFQFPLLLIAAIKMNLLRRESLKGKRKLIYGALIAFAFFISPGPEALSELIVAAVLVILFELSLIIARFF